MTTLIVGPSGVGKSTLIDSAWLRHHAPTPDSTTTVYGYQVQHAELPADASYVHYNLLHYLLPSSSPGRHARSLLSARANGVYRRWRRARAALPLARGLKRIPPSPKFYAHDTAPPDALSSDAVLAKILLAPSVDRVIVVAAPLEELLDRASRRTRIESRTGPGSYNGSAWRERLRRVDLFALYEQLFALLESRGLPFEVIFSSRRIPGGFAISDRSYVHHNLRGRYVSPPPEHDVASIKEHPGCQYQTVILPLGMRTGAKNYSHVEEGRNLTYDTIFDESLAGSSVLDIGCAIGDFLFRAERQGATRLIGVEMDYDRASAARAIGRLLMSTATIHHCGFVDLPVDGETFDYVLALNIIHHVRDIDTFLHRAVERTRKKLIIEFPTLTDKKFARYRGIELGSGYDKLPLIGVSGAGADQTYVFAPRALREIVLEIDDEFRTTHESSSPIANRRILTFTR